MWSLKPAVLSPMLALWDYKLHRPSVLRPALPVDALQSNLHFNIYDITLECGLFKSPSIMWNWQWHSVRGAAGPRCIMYTSSPWISTCELLISSSVAELFYRAGVGKYGTSVVMWQVFDGLRVKLFVFLWRTHRNNSKKLFICIRTKSIPAILALN